MKTSSGGAISRKQLSMLGLLTVGLSALVAYPQTRDEKSTKPARFELKHVRGRVVWLPEALFRRCGVKQVPEAKERVLALETKSGEVYPLVEDVRGHGFRRDQSLRKMNLELVIRIYRGVPIVQVVRVYEIGKQGKYEVDCWCDICEIAMYELKPYECCQAKIELRRRRVAQKK